MKHIVFYLILVCGLFFYQGKVAAENNLSLREQVVPVPSEKWNRPSPQGTFSDDVRYMLRMNNKYTLNKWYYEIKHFQDQAGDYLDFGGKTEHFIRPVSHHVFTLSVCLKLQIYDPAVTGVPEKQASDRLVRLIRSVAYRHKANSGEDGWGDQWQSALWASQVAQAAWLIWDRLPAPDQELVCRMMVHEADRFMDYQVPYYRDADGNIISKGNTRAEENAWNSNILTIATAMMPGHEHYDRWMRKNIELQISSYAMPEDVCKSTLIDGIPLNKILKGSNMNSDGTVINHDIMHPDYMTAFMHNGINAWFYELAGKPVLQSSLYNGEVVYHALTERLFNGKTLYQKTTDGKASSSIYYPEGNDWGGKRQANYWLMDIMAHVFGWDRNAAVKGLEWASARNTEMIAMLNRDVTGQYYQDLQEDKFPSREEWFGSHIAWGYLGWWLHTKTDAQQARAPMMGWSSWNTYRVKISSEIIKQSADAMVEKGLDKVGYQYINIDDGFFGGRDEDGRLLSHPEKFPNGMKEVADYIHSKGLKAGIYSDAGANTCGSIWDNDTYGFGVGLWGHQQRDLNLFLKEWGYDFLKVDFCGGDKLGQDIKERYTSIYKGILATGRTDVRYNICRWAFPGTWAIQIGDSWRIHGDIANNFNSVKKIINKNLYFAQYASPGHYNDMDILEIDRGLTLEQERTHFSMWCIMSSPLMIGCNMKTIRDESLAIIKNEELIAINQDPLGMQARVIAYSGNGIVLAKPLENKRGGIRAVALYNPSNEPTAMRVDFKDLCLYGKVTVRDLWKHEDLGLFQGGYETTVPANGTVVLKIEGKKWYAPSVYEGEYAFMNAFYEDGYYPEKNTKLLGRREEASGHHVMTGIGGSRENWAEFREVYSPRKQQATLRIHYFTETPKSFDLAVNGQPLQSLSFQPCKGKIAGVVTVSIQLEEGDNVIRLSNPKETGPDVDKIEVVMKAR